MSVRALFVHAKDKSCFHSLFVNLLLYWLLLFTLIHFQLPFFSGYLYSAPPFIWYPLQLILLYILSRLLPKEMSSPLEILPVFFAVFLTIPTFILSFTNLTITIEEKTKYLTILSVLLVQYLFSMSSKLVSSISRIENRRTLTVSQILSGLLVFTAALSVAVVFFGKLSFTVTNVYDVYDMRARFLQQLSSLDNPFVSYGIGWLGGILTALLFLLAIIERRLIPASLSLVIGAGIYMGAYQKWILGTFPFIGLMLLIARKRSNGKLQTIRVIRTFAFFVFLSHILKSIFQLQILVDLPVRRTILDPAVMFQYYFQFSQEYEHQFWSDSNVARLFSSGPNQTVAQIIGERYFNLPYFSFLERRSPMNATAGMIADGVGQGGILGLLLASFAMIAFFWFLSLLSKGRNFSIVFGMSTLAFILLMEGALHTAILSRGLILIPIVMFLLPRNANQT